ncbi:hypothetical protein [Propionibacterium freudenreichii]|nr:hypothetical protein [Propionibacterium freudenreichii]
MTLFGRSRRQAWGTKVVYERVDDARGNKVGAAVHDIGSTNVLTLLVVPTPQGGIHEVSSRIECQNSNPFTWTHSFHIVDGTLLDVGRTDQMPAFCVPMWAEFAVASYLAEHDKHEPIECSVIDESTGDAHPAVFAWSGHDSVVWSVDGAVRCRHGVTDGEITVSEWPGFTSVRESDEDELLRSISAQIRYRVVDFVRGIESR